MNKHIKFISKNQFGRKSLSIICPILGFYGWKISVIFYYPRILHLLIRISRTVKKRITCIVCTCDAQSNIAIYSKWKQYPLSLENVNEYLTRRLARAIRKMWDNTVLLYLSMRAILLNTLRELYVLHWHAYSYSVEFGRGCRQPRN